MLHCVTLLSLILWVSAQTALPPLCTTPELELRAGSTVVKWFNCSTKTFIYNTDADQNYSYKYLDLREVQPDGKVVFSSAAAIDLSVLEEQTGEVYSPYLIEFEELFYEDALAGRSLSFHAPGVFQIIFSLYNRTVEVEYGGETIEVQAGSLKIDTRLSSWPYQRTDNVLETYFEISSDHHMVECNLTDISDSFVQAFCEGTKNDYRAVYPKFAVVNGNRHNLKFDLVNQTALDGTPFHPDNKEFLESSSYDQSSNDECEQTLKEAQIRSGTFRVTIPYFVGNLFFDPEISVLLQSGGRGGDCSSNGYNILEDPIYWLSVSFVILALCILLLIMGFASTSKGRKLFTGRDSLEATLHNVDRRAQVVAQKLAEQESAL